MTSCYVARLGVMPPRRRTSTGEPEPSTSPSAPDRTSAPAARPRPAAKAAKATPKDPAAAPAEPLRPASVGRYPVEDLDPVVAHGTRPVKAVVGEHLTVSATVFREGHDAVAATVVLTGADGATSSVPMAPSTTQRTLPSGRIAPFGVVSRTGNPAGRMAFMTTLPALSRCARLRRSICQDNDSSGPAVSGPLGVTTRFTPLNQAPASMAASLSGLES